MQTINLSLLESDVQVTEAKEEGLTLYELFRAEEDKRKAETLAQLQKAKDELFEVMQAIVDGTCRTQALEHAEEALKALNLLIKEFTP